MAFDPQDASLLGLSGIATQSAQNVGNSGISGIQSTLGSPTSGSIANEIDLADGDINTLETDLGSGTTLVTVGGYAPGQAPPSAASIWTAGTRTLTAQADTPGTTTLLGLTNVGHTAFTGTALANAPSGGSGGASAATIAAAVWDEPTSAHVTSGTFGPAATTDGRQHSGELLGLYHRTRLHRQSRTRPQHVCQRLRRDGDAPGRHAPGQTRLSRATAPQHARPAH